MTTDPFTETARAEAEAFVRQAMEDAWTDGEEFEHLPRVTLKGLRHTHATILMELGVPPKVVQERLGHSTITTTMNIYSHVTPTMQKNAVEQFAGRLAGA